MSGAPPVKTPPVLVKALPVKPPRYCIWFGARRAPMQDVSEIRRCLEAFQPFEFHSRDWEHGGFIVLWLCPWYMFCFYDKEVLFQLSFSSYWFFWNLWTFPKNDSKTICLVSLVPNFLRVSKSVHQARS